MMDRRVELFLRNTRNFGFGMLVWGPVIAAAHTFIVLKVPSNAAYYPVGLVGIWILCGLIHVVPGALFLTLAWRLARGRAWAALGIAAVAAMDSVAAVLAQLGIFTRGAIPTTAWSNVGWLLCIPGFAFFIFYRGLNALPELRHLHRQSMRAQLTGAFPVILKQAEVPTPMMAARTPPRPTRIPSAAQKTSRIDGPPAPF
jgi:hypothetical protein